MQRPSLLDSAGLYLGIGGIIAVIGGLSVAVGTSMAEASDTWRNPWFVGGLAASVIGVLSLLWAVVLFVAHAHAARHISGVAQASLGASSGEAIREWAAGRAALSLEARNLTYELATAARTGGDNRVTERASLFVSKAIAFVERYDTDGTLRTIFEAGGGDSYLGSRIPRAPDSFDHASMQHVAIHRWLVEHTPQPRG